MTESPDDIRPVAILGMHRSGTSCLAGSLQLAGLYLGSVNEVAPYNAKGNRENVVIMRLHDDVLAGNHGSWDHPPADPRWSESARDRLMEIISGYPADRAWGFKDPRTTVVLQGWLDARPDLRLVGSFREPMAVARSLQHRNGFPLATGLDLWLQYNQRLLAWHDRYGFPLVNFDLDEPEYRLRVASVSHTLGLPAPDVQAPFFDRSLRHNDGATDQPLPAAVQAVRDELIKRSV
ncbi:MAG: sulfotransferase family protein [Planctomycetota bacterium]